MLHVVFRKIQGYLEPQLIYARYVSRIFRHILKVTHIETYLPTLGLGSVENNVKKYLLFKSSSFFKSLFKSIWNILFIFLEQVNT